MAERPIISHKEFVAARAKRTPTSQHIIRCVPGYSLFADAAAAALMAAAAACGELLCLLIIIVGLSCGDEGKGKAIGDAIRGNSKRARAGLVFRFGGGPNAGHCTHMPRDSPDLWVGPNFDVNALDESAGPGMIKLPTHQLPTGILFAAEPGNMSKSVLCYIGHGCLVNLQLLSLELAKLERLLGHPPGTMQVNLMISAAATLITPEHRVADASGGVAGSTGNGISQAAAARAARKAVRVADLFAPELHGGRAHEAAGRTIYVLGAYHDASGIPVPDDLRPRIDEAGVRWLGSVRVIDTIDLIKFTKGMQTIIAEGAQGAMLDIDHGSYPFCTSTKSVACLAQDYGLLVHLIMIIGIMKAYWTYVGNALMERNFNKDITYSGDYEFLRAAGNELGTTTGRRRQVSTLNLDDIIDSIRLDGVTQLMINKADVFAEAQEMYDAQRAGTFPAWCAERMSGWGEKRQKWAVGMIAYLAANPEAASSYPTNLRAFIRNGTERQFATWDEMFAAIVTEIRANCPTVREIVDYDSISGNVALQTVEDQQASD